MTSKPTAGKEYAGADCTLNGRPAKIIGAWNDYATVASLDGELYFDWSWAAVARIMTAGGVFHA